MASVAVVGGTGFLGRHVVAALGTAALPLSRRTGFDALRPDPAALRGCEAVVNLVGIKREAGAQTFRAVHVDAVERLVAALKEAGVPRLVHVSVVVARPDPHLPYPQTKWEGEEIVRKSGLAWTILRPGVIYGQGDDMLSHLSLMIRAAPFFPIVNDGSAPMMPVDAKDVAAAVAAALRTPASAGRTYDIVGPDRLRLRDVVERVAEAAGLPFSIWPTPAALMRLPVRIMEAAMRQPLSTRAQLAMLVEGMAGDPEPARRELGLEPAPFTVERLRPLLPDRRPPVDLRLRSAPRPLREVPTGPFWLFCAAAVGALTAVFGLMTDKWLGMALAMTTLLAGACGFRAARSRLRPNLFRILLGLAAGLALYGATRGGAALLPQAWEPWKQQLYAWRGGHGLGFLLPTLLLIVVAEEAVWRGVVTRFMLERLGRPLGLLTGAGLYTAAHAATMNPLLLAAALGCGIFWGWLYAATDDLTAPVVSHLVWDALAIFIAPL